MNTRAFQTGSPQFRFPDFRVLGTPVNNNGAVSLLTAPQTGGGLVSPDPMQAGLRIPETPESAPKPAGPEPRKDKKSDEKKLDSHLLKPVILGSNTSQTSMRPATPDLSRADGSVMNVIMADWDDTERADFLAKMASKKSPLSLCEHVLAQRMENTSKPFFEVFVQSSAFSTCSFEYTADCTTGCLKGSLNIEGSVLDSQNRRLRDQELIGQHRDGFTLTHHSDTAGLLGGGKISDDCPYCEYNEDNHAKLRDHIRSKHADKWLHETPEQLEKKELWRCPDSNCEALFWSKGRNQHIGKCNSKGKSSQDPEPADNNLSGSSDDEPLGIHNLDRSVSKGERMLRRSQAKSQEEDRLSQNAARQTRSKKERRRKEKEQEPPAPESLVEEQDQEVQRPFPEEDVDQHPVPEAADQPEAKETCSICDYALRQKELKIAKLPDCEHVFHSPCLVRALMITQRCPIDDCQTEVDSSALVAAGILQTGDIHALEEMQSDGAPHEAKRQSSPAALSPPMAPPEELKQAPQAPAAEQPAQRPAGQRPPDEENKAAIRPPPNPGAGSRPAPRREERKAPDGKEQKILNRGPQVHIAQGAKPKLEDMFNHLPLYRKPHAQNQPLFIGTCLPLSRTTSRQAQRDQSMTEISL
jgi:hypothetical protein